MNVVPEHAFEPGDGVDSYVRTCQFPGCGHDFSEHEEAEPCCLNYMEGTDWDYHEFGCPDRIRYTVKA